MLYGTSLGLLLTLLTGLYCLSTVHSVVIESGQLVFVDAERVHNITIDLDTFVDSMSTLEAELGDLITKYETLSQNTTVLLEQLHSITEQAPALTALADTLVGLQQPHADTFENVEARSGSLVSLVDNITSHARGLRQGIPDVILEQRIPDDGSNAGSIPSSSTWDTSILTHVERDAHGKVTLNGDGTFHLSDGLWYVEAYGSMYHSARSTLCVYDLDAGSVLVQGTAEYASNEYSVYGIYAQTKSVLAGTFTSVATNHLALRKRASSVGAPFTEQGIGQGEFADGFESINGHLRFWHIDN